MDEFLAFAGATLLCGILFEVAIRRLSSRR